jgi:dihydroorotate dehydrogenase (fumarate)
MNLETNYLGLKLRAPLIVGASPFCDDAHVARQLDDAGAGAVIMRSLFEEKIDAEQRALTHFVELGSESHSEAMTYFPYFAEYQLAMDQYLRQVENLRATLSIPVIASLNGYRPGGWTEFAARCEGAGANAIELNLYQLATDPALNSAQVEEAMLETVRLVVQSVRIPVAVKLSPFHTTPVQFVLALERVGAAGVVLFNRFYQPDFNIEELEVEPRLILSNSSELLLRLRWLSIISPRLKGSLSATGGAHTTQDVVKALLAGAHTVQLVSVLLKHGPRFLSTLLDGLRHWMEEHGYGSIAEFRGAMNLSRCPDPAAFERANYQRILQSWRI